MRDVRTLPKAHLHVHLESTVRPGTVREWGGPPEPDGGFTTFRQFADQRARVRELLTTADRFRRVAVEFCADEAAQGTRYVEVTFTAASHGERVGDPEMPLEAVLDGLAEGRPGTGSSAGCCSTTPGGGRWSGCGRRTSWPCATSG
ncbi:hypothetical protein ACFQ0B_40275 [Nonomuraea thailandensis]